jgi:hypothetical protein
MKRLLLLVTGLLMSLTTVNAQHAKKGKDFKQDHSRFAEPISFIERGVEFLIFPDGSFDFNTNFENSYYNDNTYYRTNNSRETSLNVTISAPGTISRAHFTNRRDQGVLITHDHDGKVRRIGNVFINYDFLGRITRAGSVYMSYQRGNGHLRQVGGLRVNYNHWGEIVHVTGMVNQSNTYNRVGITRWEDYNDHDFDQRDDSNYYYYRKGKDIKKQKRIKT